MIFIRKSKYGLTKIMKKRPISEVSLWKTAHTLLLRIFRDLPDQRVPGKVVHKLHDILVITVCAVISGLESGHR